MTGAIVIGILVFAALVAWLALNLERFDQEKGSSAKAQEPSSALKRKIRAACKWSEGLSAEIDSRLESGRWLDSEFREFHKSTKPSDPRATPRFSSQLKLLPLDLRQRWSIARELFAADLESHCRALNETLWKLEIENSKDLFDTVEAQPLTIEQREAATCFENRVQVIAAAGSGKTSVMVAKAAYAVSRGLVAPDRILMLAFNKDAATELAVRTEAAFEKIGLDYRAINVSTFHKFGLGVIGHITGEKPTLAPWVDPEARGASNDRVAKYVRDLLKEDWNFARSWFYLKTVFFRDLGAFGHDDEKEDFDKATKRAGKRTLQGEIVRSDEELMIADWLFIHGIEYRYEEPYRFRTANESRGQYRPDFFYPALDMYHEHFALDKGGNPPSHFDGYMKDVEWKRRIHAERGTRLFETTSSEIRGNLPFRRLEEVLKSSGLEPRLDERRLSALASRDEHVSSDSLIDLFLKVLAHFKSNQMSIELLRKRLESRTEDEGHIRRSLFVSVFERLYARWESDLASKNYVDFSDMIVKATGLIENSDGSKKFDLILVDEFQDTSVARFAFICALTRRSGIQLTTVGDDWQSINRFAGADLSVMTSFSEFFVGAESVSLTRTFRCDQDIADFSSQFIMRNPRQQTKQVLGQSQGSGAHVHIHFLDELDQSASKSSIRRDAIASIINGNVKEENADGIGVLVLARYRFELHGLRGLKPVPGVNVRFMTIHASKGLEDDVVIVVGMNAGTKYGFPSKIADDSLLELVMPKADTFPNSEERRLFYVAATRARRHFHILTARHNPSEFVHEALRDYPRILKAYGAPAKAEGMCPLCHGKLTRFTGKNSDREYFGCDRTNCGYHEPIRT
jgi:DNA helicase-4